MAVLVIGRQALLEFAQPGTVLTELIRDDAHGRDDVVRPLLIYASSEIPAVDRVLPQPFRQGRLADAGVTENVEDKPVPLVTWRDAKVLVIVPYLRDPAHEFVFLAPAEVVLQRRPRFPGHWYPSSASTDSLTPRDLPSRWHHSPALINQLPQLHQVQLIRHRRPT